MKDDPEKKQLGYLLLRVFKSIFTENEEQWKKVITRLSASNKLYKLERDTLLSRFLVKDEIKDVYENYKDTRDNLIKHKNVIAKLIEKSYGLMS